MKSDALIIGAGPCGISASFELSKKGASSIVIEKNPYIGGLSSTLQFGKFRTDIGPHRFFSKNRYLYDMIEDLLGSDWIAVNRLTRFYIRDKFFMYPVDIMDTLKNLGFSGSLSVIYDYAYEKLKNNFSPRKIKSFEDKIISDFGRSLAELNMLNYTEKIWGLPCSKISPDWATQRIKDLSILEVIKKALNMGSSAKTLVDMFYYPKYGTKMIYEAMAKRSLNSRIIMESSPVSLRHEGGKIKAVRVLSKEGEMDIEADNFISTMPLTELVKIITPSLDNKVLESAEKLKYRSHVSLFLAIDRQSLFNDQWVYLPDSYIPFGRMMEPRNFSHAMSEDGKTSLLLEFFCWYGDEVWQASSEKLLELALPRLNKIFSLKREEIFMREVHRERFAYPVYDLDYKKNLEIVKKAVSSFSNLQVAGRGGAFKYNNQDHAIEMGLLSASNIIESPKYNLDDIGSEQAYFEKGYVK